MEQLLSRNDVAKILNISPSSLSAHDISHFRVGKHVRYRPCDVDAYLEHIQGDSRHLLFRLLNEYFHKYKDGMAEDIKNALVLLISKV